MDKPTVATDLPSICCGVYLSFLERLQFLKDKRRLLEEDEEKNELVNQLEVR